MHRLTDSTKPFACCLVRLWGRPHFHQIFFNCHAHVWCVCFDFSIPIWVWPRSDLDWLNRSLTCCRNCERPHTCIVLRIQPSQLLVDLLLLLKDGKKIYKLLCNDRLGPEFCSRVSSPNITVTQLGLCKSTIDWLEAWLVVETARGRICASSYGFNQAICLLPCRAVGLNQMANFLHWELMSHKKHCPKILGRPQ